MSANQHDSHYENYMGNVWGQHDEQEKYYQSKLMQEQKNQISYKSCSTSTSVDFIWTYRTTACDVISVITTTMPMKNGLMKDIKVEHKDVITIRQKSHLMALKDSPFQIKGLHVDVKEEKKKMNKLLLAERRVFMTKLNISRYYRSKVENSSATRIQSVYRGYYTRSNALKVQESNAINKQIRGNIKSYLANRYGVMVSLSDYKSDRMMIRNRAVSIIQDKFICYLSRQALRRRRSEKLLRSRARAVVIIQALVRGKSARSRIRLMLEKVRQVVARLAALRVQTCFRAFFGRRSSRRRKIVLHMMASALIINWYKAKYLRKMAAQIFSLMKKNKQRMSSTRMQCLVRQFLAKCRVQRMRLRRLHKKIFRAATLMIKIVRRFLAKLTVQRKLWQKQDREEAEARAAQEKELAATQVELENEQKELLDSVNIFLQASLGNTEGTEDIFTGLASVETHTPTDTNADGDTLLTIATAKGNLELVRKCLLWGFDVNHRNQSSDSPLLLAAKNDYLMVLQYILALPGLDPDHDPDLDDGSAPVPMATAALAPISVTDAGSLMVAAAANTGSSGTDMMMTLIDLGLDINSIDVNTGMTAMHAACEVGNIEAFKILYKYKCVMTIKDNMGQLAFHKACSSSFQLSQMILGLDPSFSSSFLTDEQRTELLDARDHSGKDASVIAALGGQSELLELYEELLKAFPAATPNGDYSISWTTSDLTQVVALIDGGNLFCMSKVLHTHFDTTLAMPGEGTTLAMAACTSANLDMINLIMDGGADFSCVSSDGSTALHFGAKDPEETVIAHVLTHGSASKCKVSASDLLTTTYSGDTVFHTAASNGRALMIDLIAGDAIEQAKNMQNKAGQTPLMIASSLNLLGIVDFWLSVDSDVHKVDLEGHTSLWHLIHPQQSVFDAKASKRPVCSQVGFTATAKQKDRKTYDEGVTRLKAEVSLALSILERGSALYDDTGITSRMEAMVTARASKKGGKSSTTIINPTPIADLMVIESGDVLVKEGSTTLLKKAVSCVSQLDCWRLVLSSIALDPANELGIFFALIGSGCVDMLGVGLLGVSSKEQKVKNKSNHTSLSVLDNINVDSKSLNPISLSEVATDAAALTTAHVKALQDLYFLGVNIVGWIVRFRHMEALDLFLQRGYDITASVDNVGNPLLHYVAQNGDVSMLNKVLHYNPGARIELFSASMQTPAMMSVQAHNFGVFRRLYDLGIAPRLALDVRYAAWVLAFVKRKEKQEKNTNTRRVEFDDVRYDVSAYEFGNLYR